MFYEAEFAVALVCTPCCGGLYETGGKPLTDACYAKTMRS